MKRSSAQVKVVEMVIKNKAGIKLAFFTATLLKKASDLIYKFIETPSVNKDVMVFRNESAPFLTSNAPPVKWAEKIAAAGEVQWFAWSDHTGLTTDTRHINTPDGPVSKKETDVHYTFNPTEHINDNAQNGFSKKKNRIFNKTTKTWIHPRTKEHIVSEFQNTLERGWKQDYSRKETSPNFIEKKPDSTNVFLKKTSPKSTILPKKIDEPFANLKEPFSVKTEKTFINNKTKPKTIFYDSHGPTWPINTQTQPSAKYESNSKDDFDFRIKSKKNGAVFKKNKKSGIQTKTKIPLNRDKKTDTDINLRRIEKQVLNTKDNKNRQKPHSYIKNIQTMSSEVKTKAENHTSASKGVWPKLPEITSPVWKYNPAINVSERITILETEQKGGLWSV
nr:hypothetical protein [uncultured Desulfobacter sp.]